MGTRYNEFHNYRNDAWWWFATYLDLAASICENPKLSSRNEGLLGMIEEVGRAAEEYERLKRRSLSLYGSND